MLQSRPAVHLQCKAEGPCEITVECPQNRAALSPLFCAHLRRSFEVYAWSTTGEVPPERTTGFKFDPASAAQPNFIPLSRLEESI